MSTRTRYSIVKGASPDCARSLIADAAKSLPGSPPKHSKWADWTYIVRPKTFHALACADALVLTDDAWLLAQEVARILDAPHLELRVQESDHWDFTLCHRSEVLADFSTRVAYFDSDPHAPRPWKKGGADVFADVWGIPRDRIAPYLKDWGALQDPLRVREGDKYSTGDWRQVYDFLSAIGADDPRCNANDFTVDVPSWTGTYVNQPLWRRAIRRVSVWIKGTYPDVPKRTDAEREKWNRRRASVRIVRS